MSVAPCIVIHNTNQRNVQFSKLEFNSCCVLHVSNVVDSSSGRQLYMQCGFTCIGVSSLMHRRVSSTVLSTRLLTPSYIKRSLPQCVYNCLVEDKPTTFETCRTQQKLYTNLENCAFRWFVLYNHRSSSAKWTTTNR